MTPSLRTPALIACWMFASVSSRAGAVELGAGPQRVRLAPRPRPADLLAGSGVRPGRLTVRRRVVQPGGAQSCPFGGFW